jgi:DNA-binding MarR family transcriptional regulator
MQNQSSTEACNCLAIRRAARFTSQIYERHLAHAGLTTAQFSILSRLNRTPRMTMLELAEAMLMDRTTLVRALRPLQRDALLVTIPVPGNTRVLQMELLDAGRKQLAEALPHWKEAQAEFESRFGKSRSRELREQLFELTTA